MKSLRRIRPHTDVRKVDDDLLERSRLARAGRSLIQLAIFVRAIEPVLGLVATVLLVTVPALAQTPGGNLFGGNDQQLGSGVREAIRWGRNLLFLLGVAGVGWGAANIMMEKAWGRQMLGGGICMGIGGILSLIHSFSQGTRSIWIPIWEIEAGSKSCGIDRSDRTSICRWRDSVCSSRTGNSSSSPH